MLRMYMGLPFLYITGLPSFYPFWIDLGSWISGLVSVNRPDLQVLLRKEMQHRWIEPLNLGISVVSLIFDFFDPSVALDKLVRSHGEVRQTGRSQARAQHGALEVSSTQSVHTSTGPGAKRNICPILK